MSKNNKEITFLTKTQLEIDYAELQSFRKIGKKYNITGESVRKYIHKLNVNYNKLVHYECNHNIFSEETELSFYLAGFIAADGCVYKKKNSYYLIICLGIKDYDFLEKIKNILGSTAPIRITKSPFIYKGKSYYSCSFQLTSKKIFTDLLKFNITPRKSLTYSFPKWLIKHPLVNHFIRGYFDGDGSIYTNFIDKKSGLQHMRFDLLGTKDMLENVRSILVRECGIREGVVRKVKNIYQFRHGGNNIVYAIYRYLYKNATVFLERKKLKFEYISPR